MVAKVKIVYRRGKNKLCEMGVFGWGICVAKVKNTTQLNIFQYKEAPGFLGAKVLFILLKNIPCG